MKKFLALAIVIIMAVMMVVPCSAEVEMNVAEFENAFDKLPAKYDDATKVALGTLWKDGATNARHGASDKFDYIYLKEDGKGDFVVEIELEEDGIYSFAVGIMGWKKSVLRSTDVIIDDGPRCYMGYDYVDADQHKNHYFYGVEAVLDAGKHTVTFSLAEDFDDSAVKSLYITDLYYVWEPLPEVEEAPVVEEAPAAAETATSTFDASIFALAALVVSGAGVVVSKKRK